jgi:hypothetical protein
VSYSTNKDDTAAWYERKLPILGNYLEIDKSDLFIALRILRGRLFTGFFIACMADNKVSKALGLKVLMHIAILILIKN